MSDAALTLRQVADRLQLSYSTAFALRGGHWCRSNDYAALIGGGVHRSLPIGNHAFAYIFNNARECGATEKSNPIFGCAQINAEVQFQCGHFSRSSNWRHASENRSQVSGAMQLETHSPCLQFVVCPEQSGYSGG